MSVVLCQVEKFEVVNFDATDTALLNTTLIDMSKAFMFFDLQSISNIPPRCVGTAQITSTSEVTVKRNNSAESMTCLGYVCEFTSGVAVARGTYTESIAETVAAPAARNIVSIKLAL